MFIGIRILHEMVIIQLALNPGLYGGSVEWPGRECGNNVCAFISACCI